MGIVSMNDIVLASGPRKPVRDTDVVSTLQAICRTTIRLPIAQRESLEPRGHDPA